VNITIILLIFLLLILVAVGAGIFAYFYIKKARESKDVERSLKMVPLLVKIPPRESEKEGKDVREAIKENISKAEGVYRLLSGISGKKSKVHGERYISFEIVAVGKQIYFYVAVPVSLEAAVKKALTSGYPGVQIEQKNDVNFFSKESKIGGVSGGEFELKQSYFYPINTYQMSEQDAFAALLSSLSGLDDGEGASVQILIRPTGPKWAKKAREQSKQLLNPDKKYGTEKALSIASDIAKAPFTGTSESSKEKKEDKQPDTIDQEKSKLIEEKAKYPAFETLIRVIASSSDTHRSEAIIDSIKLGFAQLALNNSNNFTYKKADDIQKFTTDYIFRYFPVNKRKTVLNSVELATVFHLPSETIEIAATVERKGMKEISAPAGLPEEGLILGTNIYQGHEQIVRLSDDDRRRHFYIIGQTGTGKSVFLENCIVQDMYDGKGVAFIDPHGDTAEKLMAKVPPERAKDVIYFNPGDAQYPMGWNIMEFSQDHPEQKDFLVQEAISMLYKIYDPNKQGFMGPRFEAWFRNAALTVMADPEGGTFIEIPKVFTDDEYLKKKFKYLTDPVIQDFWTGEMAQTDAHSKSEMLGWFASKFGAFANNEIMRNIVGQKKSAFDLREIMDEGKLLFVNLSKGLLGDINSQLLGIMFIIKFQVAAMSRADTDEKDRKDFSVYIDEFQNYSTDSIATILSEARKYRLSMFMANQFISQLDEKVRDSVFGNVGSMISFRVGADDAEYLVKQYAPAFDASDLTNIPNHYAATKIIANGVPTIPFSMKEIMPPIGTPKQEIMQSMIDQSRANYARPKAEVDADIAKALGL
jgi:type IV secretory pathway TraG/TraD family ATPase VirD4